MIAHTPVTNAEYAEFVKATGHTAPKYWTDGKMPDGKADHPVLLVSYEDAVALVLSQLGLRLPPQPPPKIDGKTIDEARL